MLERRAVTKRKKMLLIAASQIIFIILAGMSVSHMSAHAAAKRKKVAKKTAPSKTVGDILKKIDKKAEKVRLTKGQSSLPKYQPQTGGQTNQQVNLRAVTPPRSTKLYYEEGTDEAELEKVLDEGIDQLFQLAKRSAKSSKRGELWLRLAELYAEKARLIEFRLLKEHDKKSEMYQNKKLSTKPKLDLGPSIAYNKKAIQLYEWFLRDFPKDPKIDQALFFLGFNYFEIGDPKKGEMYYARLTKEYPNSLYVHESNFALGEYHFEGERWKQALPFYEKVSQFKANRLYSFAMYKIAWCLYKLSETKKGLNYLEVVILEGRRTKGQKDQGSGVSRIRLASEAIKDLIVFYAETGDPNKARGYFEEIVGPKSANANLAKLGYFYMDSGNRSNARIIFRDLIDQDPNSVKAYDYQYAIVKMYGASGDPNVFRKELYDWIQQYGPDSSWQKINKKNAEVVAKANELMETLLRNHVLQQHQTAQNAKTKTAQAAAKNGYALYFDTFPRNEKTDEMRFFYGELLFDIGDFEQAAANYNWVTENAPNSVYFKKALVNALLAYEKRLPPDDKVRKLVGDSTAPLEFTPEIKSFENAALNYFRKDPDAKDNVAVRYRMGALYYLFNQFEPAIKIFEFIIDKHPKTPFAKYSANHLLDIYNLKKDYAGLQKAADRILAVPELARSEIGGQIKDIKLRTDFKLSKDLEDKKDYLGAAKAYEDFAKRNQASDLARGARFNAAVNYERAGYVGSAIAMYSLFANERNPKKDDLNVKATKFLPVLYEKTGQYQKAAALFESNANSNPKDSLAEEYHFNAAIIYDGMNFYTAAIRNYEKYMALSKKRDKVEALFLLAKLYERRGMLDRAISYYDQYLNSSTPNSTGVVESAYQIAKLHARLRRAKVAEEWYGKTIAIQKRVSQQKGSPVGASYAAECKFLLVKKVYDDFMSIRMPRAAAAQQGAIQNKIALLNRLKEQLKGVIVYDDGRQVVAALSLQGRALENMNNTIIEAPIPAGLKPEEVQQYKTEIKKIADPFLEQAKDAFKTAVDKGYELEAYNRELVYAVESYGRLTGDKSKALQTQAIVTKLPDRGDL